jgi:hypothetical protein
MSDYTEYMEYYKKTWEQNLAENKREIDQLKEENARLKKALKFYASDDSWSWANNHGNIHIICDTDWITGKYGFPIAGRRAREALKGGE